MHHLSKRPPIFQTITSEDWKRQLKERRERYAGQAKAKRLKEQMDAEEVRRGLLPNR